MKLLKSTTVALAISASAAIAAEDENVLVIEVGGEASGTVEIELLPDLAPNHVERIKTLTRGGKLDGVVFHRVIEGFMAQTGDVEFGRRGGSNLHRAGTGGSSMPDLEAEFTDEPFARGVVGMARARDPDSANSQFFIMFADGMFLNGQYTVFGRVISGMEAVDEIKKGNPQRNGSVDDPDYIVRARIKADL